MRKLAYFVGLFLLASLPAVAQEAGSKDVSVEYSYLRANPATTGFPSFNANGGSASFAWNTRSWFGLTGEFGDYHVGQIGSTSVDTNLMTYMAGPQFYFHHFGRFTPFAQELFGGAHSSSTAFGIPGTRNSFAMALGGGVDVPFHGHWSVRLGPVDYLMTDFPETASGGRKLQNNLRVSGGVRWRF
ncbi:MAG TPA: outer membrane beta-barrel protein [Candidatus Acidoferrum sp.]